MLVLLALIVGVTPARARARSGPELVNDTLTTEYPAGITFSVEAQSNVPIRSVTLRFGATTTASCQDAVAIRDLTISEYSNVTAEYTWDFRESSTVPPGTEVWWQWEITDIDGAVLLTERRTQILEDQRFTWQTASDANLTVYWVDGNADFGRTLLAIARESADALQTEAGLTVTAPVRLTIYPDFDSMRAAILQVAEWTGGLAYSDYNAILIGIAPDQESWARAVIPHEYTHLVTGAATANCWGVYMPTWLNEGLSMHFEGTQGAAEDRDLRQRLDSGTLPSLRSLANGFSAYSDDANAAYAQSGRVVTYLLREYGPEPMSALLADVQRGTPIDAALLAAYGVDTDGIDARWRADLAGEPTPTAPPAASPSPQATVTAVPTIVAWDGIPTPFEPTTQPTAIAPQVIATPTPATTGGAGNAGSLLLAGLLLCVCILLPGALVLAGLLWLVIRGSRS